MMQDFKNLQIWKMALDLNKEMYKITLKFPKEEIYALTQQLKRASVSISSNIAEGCGRRTDRDFISFLYNSMGSLKEVENILLIAKDLGYISQSDFIKFDEDMDKLGKTLYNFIKGREENKTFTVRKMVGDIAVERIFPVLSPSIEKVVVKAHSKKKIRRAKLYYLRNN